MSEKCGGYAEGYAECLKDLGKSVQESDDETCIDLLNSYITSMHIMRNKLQELSKVLDEMEEAQCASCEDCYEFEYDEGIDDVLSILQERGFTIIKGGKL